MAIADIISYSQIRELEESELAVAMMKARGM
jgi:hypothetical protein